MNKSPTFRQIEKNKNISVYHETSVSSLDEWYQTVRDKPISQFSDKDFGIACRQEVYLEFVVPCIFDRIRSEPLAGEMYDGELLVALAGLPRPFWVNNPSLTRDLQVLLDSIAVKADFTDVITAIQELRAVVT